MVKIKKLDQFRVLMVYPNLSMLLSPPLSYAIFTALLKSEGYQVDIFDVTPYVGEGATAPGESLSVGDEMNTLRGEPGANDRDTEDTLTFQKTKECCPE